MTLDICPQVTTEMPELKLKDQGYYMGYSSSNQAGTFNGVAMSALQVFLSMIPPELVSTELHIQYEITCEFWMYSGTSS